MWVEDRCTIVTSAPFSHKSAQMSWAELLEPITTHRLPAHSVPPGWRLLWCCVAPKRSMPG